MSIRYINTDLNLEIPTDPMPLATALEKEGISHIEIVEKEGGRWYATFETVDDHTEPETAICAMLDVIENLEGDAYNLWAECFTRVFDIGYTYISKTGFMQQGLKNDTLLRMSKIGTGLTITLYGSLPTNKSR